MSFYRRFILLSVGLAISSGLVNAQIPELEKIGPQEYVSSSPMERPNVSTDSKGQPHFVCDPGGDTRFMKFHKVNGKWSGGIFAVGSPGGPYRASRLYVGQIDIDPKDRAWISCKFGCKEFGDMLGQGVWLFNNVATDPTPSQQFFRHVNVYKGMGAVNNDSKYPDVGVVMGTHGNWETLDQYGKTIASGCINAGHGGEKVRSQIASYAPRFPEKGDTKVYPDGIWHTAMEGSHVVPAAYQNSARYKAGLGYVPWADFWTFPEMGDDYHHPGVCGDLTDPKIAYISAYLKGQTRINIYNGGRMLFPITSLKVLDVDANFEQRHPPAIAPAPGKAGGAFIFWVSRGTVKTCYVSKTGVSGPVKFITVGHSPGAATDRFGNIHLVYANGGICYRKLTIRTLAPLAPEGLVGDTRTPQFLWTDTKADAYTLELTKDGVKLSTILVKAATAPNFWTPGSDLAVGSYSWRVKEGNAASASAWSPALAFVIPPDMPDATAPEGRISDNPVTPAFEWTSDDPEANRFQIQLFNGVRLQGTISVTGDVKTALTASWTNALPAGYYSWQMRSMRALLKYNIYSAWTPAMNFQIGVPGESVITDPVRGSAFHHGFQTITSIWSAAESASGYKLKLLLNGSFFDMFSDLTDTNRPIARTFNPGRYQLLVAPTNDAGFGPWSDPRSFTVTRDMSPDNNVILHSTPKKFEWTRSAEATKYLLKICQYNSTTKKYVLKRQAWIAQPAKGNPAWVPPYIIPDGKFRWAITDYDGKKQGYTQLAFFQITKSGHADWNDPSLVVGTWRVVSSWRWREMTFRSDGLIRNVQADGTAFLRAHWSADGEYLTMISDVTEKCPYTVTETTLTFKLPDGSVKQLVRIP